MKIVVLDGYTLNPGDLTWKGFEELGQFKVYDRTSYDTEDLNSIVERAKDAEVIIINKTPITKEVMDKLPNLKYIGVLATGYNVVDIEAAKDKGIIVTNVPGYGTDTVAQMTFALLLELTNHVGIHNREVKAGKWTKNIDWCFWEESIVELSGKTMGIIGYGTIGQRVGQIAQAFNMKVLATSRTHKKELENAKMKYVEIDELLEKSDVISLHSPLTEETAGIINKDTLAKMKESAIIINTSRGPLIVEEDLAEAINSGQIAGAALDVVSEEPIKEDNPLLKCDKCIITPHIAWASKEARERLMAIAVNNLKSYIDGETKNLVYDK